jgi:fructokinase
MREATVVKLNDGEAASVGSGYPTLEAFCRGVAAEYGFEAVCVTRGERGCVALIGGDYVEAPGHRVPVADTVGAGDAFAAAFLHGLGERWPPAEIAGFANRLGALVASRPGAIPPWTLEELERF